MTIKEIEDLRREAERGDSIPLEEVLRHMLRSKKVFTIFRIITDHVKVLANSRLVENADGTTFFYPVLSGFCGFFECFLMA